MAQRTCGAQALPRPGRTGFSSPASAEPVGRLAGTGSAPGARGRVPCKVSGARSGLGARTGRRCRPGVAVPSLRPPLQVDQLPSAPSPASPLHPPGTCTPGLSRPRARSAPRAPQGNRPALTLATAMLRPACGLLRDPLTGALALRTRDAHFPSGRRWRRR